MAIKMLGIGDFAATNQPGDIIRTLALGSCVSVIIMDPACRCIAMDHVALPESATSPEKARAKPGYFADTGIPAMLKEMRKIGAVGQAHSLVVKLVGGASVVDDNGTFNIGKRNIITIKRVLWGLGMGATVEDVGGRISRTVSVDVDFGRVKISSPGKPDWEI